MITNYILIDYENVQPLNLKALNKDFVKVKIFVGASQVKIPTDLVMATQSFNGRAEYIQVAGTGKNALDFYIAYYLGELTNKDLNAVYYIISKDTGFDPLIKHLKERKLKISRIDSLNSLPWGKGNGGAILLQQCVDTILKHLKARNHAKPKTLEALTNTIKSHCRNSALPDAEVVIIKELIAKKNISTEGSKVIYYF